MSDETSTPQDPPSAPGTSAADEAPARPLLHVVRGTPTDEELAALTAVVASRVAAAQGGPERPVATSAWTERAPLMRQTVDHGPGAWRASAWPR